ncbi:MAG: Prochlorococcus phage [Candidatus Parcubacteria bacterium]|jgi:hypothetical protein
MKKIVLLPTKNEDWIIDTFLKNVTAWADLVIIADQSSIDSTRDKIKQYKNVLLIDNPYIGHSNKVRWLLRDTLVSYLKNELGTEAIAESSTKTSTERSISDNHVLVFCLDADEILTQQALEWTESEAKKHIESNPTESEMQFIYPWIQLYPTATQYRTDGVWKESAQMAAFLFDITKEIPDYNRTEVVNDHTTRIPTIYTSGPASKVPLSPTTALTATCPHPLLHLQFLAIKRTQLKQAWYMCQELIAGKKNVRHINLQYAEAIHFAHIKPKTLHTSYLKGVQIPPAEYFKTTDRLRLADIIELFIFHGITTFEALDIWHIPELRALFIEEVGRKPRLKKYPIYTRILHKYAPRPFKNMLKWAMKITRNR